MAGMTRNDKTTTPTALVTGGSAGLGLELARGLLGRGWRVIVDARDAGRLAQAASQILDGPPSAAGRLVAVAGDVTDPGHRAELARRVDDCGRLDLLVHTASTLGPTPLRPLAWLDPTDLDALWATNVVAANALTALLAPRLKADHGVLVSISSDAAVEHYETWGGYGATKAALDHLTLTWAAETGITGYAVDPGDMRTAMHASAFPGEDISDRPLPATVVPRLLALLDERPVSGRYRAADFTPVSEASTGVAS